MMPSMLRTPSRAFELGHDTRPCRGDLTHLVDVPGVAGERQRVMRDPQARPFIFNRCPILLG